MTTIVISTEQAATLKLLPQTALGKPSQIEAGSIKVELVNGGAAAEVLSDSQVKFTHTDIGTDLTSTTTYFVKGDADLGEGVAEIVEEVTIIVTVPQAVGFGTEVTVEPIV